MNAATQKRRNMEKKLKHYGQELSKRVITMVSASIASTTRFLLLFLRARYFRVDTSYELLCNYHEFRNKNASIFQNISAWQLHHVIEDGFPCVLPYSNQNGAKMMVIFAGGWDTETYGTVDILKAFVLSMERLIEDDEVQRNGIVIIADFTGWTTTHTSHLSIAFIRQVCCMFQVRNYASGS